MSCGIRTIEKTPITRSIRATTRIVYGVFKREFDHSAPRMQPGPRDSSLSLYMTEM